MSPPSTKDSDESTQPSTHDPDDTTQPSTHDPDDTTQPSTNDTDTSATTTTDSAIQLASSALAVFVLVATYVEVEATPAWYPTWLYLGELTLPTAVLPPMLLGLVVLASELRTLRGPAGVTAAGILCGVLALLVEATGLLAVLTLNQSSGGVFWAGLPPLLFGVLLALFVIGRALRHRYTSYTGQTA